MNLKDLNVTSSQYGYAILIALITMVVNLFGPSGDSMTPRNEYIPPPKTPAQSGPLLV